MFAPGSLWRIVDPLLSTQTSKIGEVMRHIASKESDTIPRDDEFKFRDRAQALVNKWHQILNSANGAGTNGKPSSSSAAKPSAPAAKPASTAAAPAPAVDKTPAEPADKSMAMDVDEKTVAHTNGGEATTNGTSAPADIAAATTEAKPTEDAPMETDAA